MSIDNLYPGLVTPLPVAEGYHPFVDNRFIHPGRAHWVDDEGRFHSAWGLKNPTSIHAEFLAVPRGVELRAEPAVRTEPVLKATEPWERLVWWPKVMHEGGRLPALVRGGSTGSLGPGGRSRAGLAEPSFRRTALLRRVGRRVQLDQAEVGDRSMGRVHGHQHLAGAGDRGADGDARGQSFCRSGRRSQRRATRRSGTATRPRKSWKRCDRIARMR